MTSIGHSARRVLLAATMVALTACSVFEDNPYADFSIGKVDEKSAQTAAAILVGDPQVISRETLINDRLREVRHLEFMLQESVSQTFEPQIRRDLSVIEAFAGQLGISFNPAIGRDFARREDIESARAEIELIKLQNEIDELNKLRQTDPSNAALNPTNANMGTPTAITDPNTTSIETRLAEAAKKANDLVASLTPEPGKGPRARSSSLESSPEEHFEDLNAYRARIRQRLTEVGLDDVHDANGNALYRLQFTATVLPGAVKNKFGVLDLEIASAEARADQVSRLYLDWLVSLMRRGVEEQSAGNPVEWERLQTVMLQNELMDYVPLEHPVYTQKGLNDLILFTYPGHQDIVREAIDNPCIAEALEASAMSRELGDKCAKNDSGETITYDPGALSKNLIETFPSLSAIEVFLSSYRSELLRDGGAGEIELSHDLRALAAQLSKAAYGARDLREQGTSTAVDQAPQTAGVQAPGCWKEIEALPVPSSFVDTVVWHNGTECRWRGQPYTYQAQPTERVQRLSTLASAANSMQLAFSLAATLPTQGLGINAGAAASRTAVGLAEAIERTPLVIGYTDRQSLTQDADSTARFGYVFGPKAILEPEENQLVYRQISANHPVYADVSVPGWWPEMLLKIRTAWAGNWHQGTGILNNMQPDGGRQISLRLRPQQRATATLTGFIADGLLPSGFESTTITEVIPNPVSACAGRIEFLIKGRNLWRGSEVYLRGKRHEGLRVLPDMRGLAVTFDMNSLPRTPDRVAPAEMIVWTSFGPGRYPIEIVDTVDGQPCAGSPEATDAIALRPHLPRFVNIAMAKLRGRVGHADAGGRARRENRRRTHHHHRRDAARGGDGHRKSASWAMVRGRDTSHTAHRPRRGGIRRRRLACRGFLPAESRRPTVLLLGA